MHIDLRQYVWTIIGAVVLYIALWKIIFWLFSPSETFVMFIISVIVGGICFIAYGIQRVEWETTSKISFFGVIFRSSSTVYSQLKVLGIFPIGAPQLISCNDDYFPNPNELKKFLVATGKVFNIKCLIPFAYLMKK